MCHKNEDEVGTHLAISSSEMPMDRIICHWYLWPLVLAAWNGGPGKEARTRSSEPPEASRCKNSRWRKETNFGTEAHFLSQKEQELFSSERPQRGAGRHIGAKPAPRFGCQSELSFVSSLKTLPVEESAKAEKGKKGESIRDAGNARMRGVWVESGANWEQRARERAPTIHRSQSKEHLFSLQRHGQRLAWRAAPMVRVS